MKRKRYSEEQIISILKQHDVIGQFGYRAYKKNHIIVERIPHRGYALREQMTIHNMRVVK